jgi:4-methyl-5(b-hydroxyethyl)-thiazole monophosphate biosynthesis
MSKVVVPFTEGFEEIECVAVVDILRRAGVLVCLASLDGGPVTGRSGITVHPDAALAGVMDEDWDMVVLPGGMPNAHLLRDDANVQALVTRLYSQRKSVAAICAAPVALAAYGMLGGRRVTSHPGVEAELREREPSAVYVDDAVVEDDFLVTSRGAGTAVAFALRLVTRLCGQERADQVRDSIVAP